MERCRLLRKGVLVPSSENYFALPTPVPILNSNVKDKKIHGESQRIVVVHAYADRPYDRSSFHLAGRADFVADVAAFVAGSALSSSISVLPSFGEMDKDDEGDEEWKHPTVGIVDHISIMPLSYTITSITSQENSHTDVPFVPSNAHGRAASYVTETLKQLHPSLRIYPYGEAHPHGASLASVRRERTSFFSPSNSTTFTATSKSIHNRNTDRENKVDLGACTIGAPSTFVENYNIRLTPAVTQKEARRLTRAVRERDGGVVGVEALTLPYGGGKGGERYEVACNLTKVGDSGCVEEIEGRVVGWLEEMRRKRSNSRDNCGEGDRVEIRREELVEVGYRVGTTVDQCQDVLTWFDDEGKMSTHDTLVAERLRGYLVS